MEQIRIQTFGKFEITYEGKVYKLERSQSTKTAHLMQYFALNQGRSFEKSELVDILYEKDEVSDPLNNLKVNIFRLRQMLADHQQRILLVVLVVALAVAHVDEPHLAVQALCAQVAAAHLQGHVGYA